MTYEHATVAIAYARAHRAGDGEACRILAPAIEDQAALVPALAACLGIAIGELARELGKPEDMLWGEWQQRNVRAMLGEDG